MTQRAADLLVDCLAAQGTDRIFCVPGESYLPVLDALHGRNDIDTVTCRHEGGAAFMALADAKLTHRPGIAFVSRGPGATNASIGVHSAEQDAAPLILFVGHVPRGQIGRGAFQEVDYAKTFADMAKAVLMVDDPDRIPELVARAYAVARSPTPGPVVVVLPEDVLEAQTAARPQSPAPAAVAGDGGEDAAEVARRIAAARRPLLIAGVRLATPEGRAALVAAAEALGVPVVLSFKMQHLMPNRHPLYAGHLGFKIPAPHRELLAEADLVVAVGTRLGEVVSQGYRFPRAPVPDQPLIHVHDDPRQLGRVHRHDLAVMADPAAFLRRLAGATTGRAPADWAERLHAYVAERMPWQPPANGGLDPGPVVARLAEVLPDDAILITDAGNFSGWLHRHFPFGPGHDLIGAVGGAMGLGVPAAVAAGLRAPGRSVVTFVGDGGMLMTGAELATAVRHRVPVRIFVSNNGSYGTIRMHQERDFPGRVAGTDLANPDFARLAEAYGARGLTIAAPDEAARVTDEALATDGPVVVDIRTEVENITAFATLADLRN
jgi:acetolactate synthase I/II/III large subunit